MELQTFIEESLKQIVAAVANAARATQEHGARMNPAQPQWQYGHGLYFDKTTGAVLSNVEFDVAVTATDGTKTKGGIGVALASVVLGSQGESAKSNQQVSRIKFNVPIVLPSSLTEEEAKSK
ncbi:MAG TPA: hypothetical protein PLX89_07725 [Verrucomicrobiota bacterium]|nr:hypothetical protein [Verrucomicrobiales bacterium]HRI12878.1 hypothetical protein [Verrucomicrobiota bacterium]